jgi:hypothetical protein
MAEKFGQLFQNGLHVAANLCASKRFYHNSFYGKAIQFYSRRVSIVKLRLDVTIA